MIDSPWITTSSYILDAIIFNFLNLKKSYAILMNKCRYYFLRSECFLLDRPSRQDVLVELFPARYAIWRSKSPSSYLAMWRPTWITNLKSALSQAFSVKLRAVALTSAVTIFSRTRRGQPGDFRARIIARILASSILRYVMVEAKMVGAAAPVMKLRSRGKREGALRLLRRTDLAQSRPLLFFFFFFSYSFPSLFLSCSFLSPVFDEISEQFNRPTR